LGRNTDPLSLWERARVRAGFGCSLTLVFKIMLKKSWEE
jgi:hypothetical protein